MICIGNLVVGGAGKTPVALKVGELLKILGYKPNFISRGYSGKITGNIRIEEKHSADEVGDESLILAETGNTIGAIQVAGTAMPAQLPFFVAACDYTLIGEEFFAASFIECPSVST